jgi:GT2 family glycosyltransferase
MLHTQVFDGHMRSKGTSYSGLAKAPSRPAEILLAYLSQIRNRQLVPRRASTRNHLSGSTEHLHSTLQADLPNIAIITPNFNGRQYVKKFFRAIENVDYPKEKLTLFFIDNASRDLSVEQVRKMSQNTNIKIRLIANKSNLGFARSCNLVLLNRTEHPDFFLIVNNDAEIDRDCVRHLVAKMDSDNRIALCEARQLPNAHPKPFDAATGNTSWCSGATLLMKTAAVQLVGGFDENFFMYCEDVDLSWRMWLNGFRCVYVPEATCLHYVSETKDAEAFRVYYRIRNGMFMRWIYGSPFDILFYHLVTLIRGCAREFKLCLVARALGGEIKHLPYLMKRRLRLYGLRKKCPFVGFFGTEYHPPSYSSV